MNPRTDAVTPGGWSTAATPGSPAVFRFDEADKQSTTPTTRAWVSEELEGVTGDHPELALPVDGGEDSPISSIGGQKQVRFSPTVVDGPSSPTFGEDIQGPVDVGDPRVSPRGSLSLPSAPSFFPGHGVQIPPSAPSLPPLPPPVEYNFHESQSPSYRAPPPQVPYSPIPPPIRAIHPVPEAATITQAPPVELTPQVIARIQKHCKFAISALDYEDAAQARKELRAALKMLGD